MVFPRISLWIKLVVIAIFIVVVLNLVGFPGAKTSVYLGLLFLILTLVPIHFKKFVKYRRDFGITSGVLMLLHGSLAFNTVMGGAIMKLFHDTIVNGYIAALIIMLLLVTSSYFVQRKLGNKWRTLHALIWFSLPLSLLHAVMAAQYYTGDLPVLALLILGGLGIFGIAKIFLPRTNTKENIRDASLVILGILFGIGIVLL